MLLKPWRNLITDLKDSSQSWKDAFNHFLDSTTPPQRSKIEFILSDIQYYHDCRHAAQKSRETNQHHHIPPYLLDPRQEDEMLETEDTEKNDVSDCLQNVSLGSSAEETNTLLAIEAAKMAKVFPNDQSVWSVTTRVSK